MDNNRGNIMNRKVKSYKGRNEESTSQQFNKETSHIISKNTNLSSYLDRRRKVFDGSKEEKLKIKEEYKEICDIHLHRKNILTEEMKKTEKNELKINSDVFQQEKQNYEEKEFLKRVYHKNLQADNKNLHKLSETNKRYEKLMDMHQDLSNLDNDFFGRNLMSYR